MERSEHAIAAGEERIEEVDGELHVYMTAKRSHFLPDVIRAKEGQKVVIHLTSVEEAQDITHGFAIPAYNIQVSLDPGETVSMEFEATRDRFVRLLLHRVLLGAPPRDAGLAARRARLIPDGGGRDAAPRPDRTASSTSRFGRTPSRHRPPGAPAMRPPPCSPPPSSPEPLVLTACGGGTMPRTRRRRCRRPTSSGGVTIVATEFAFDPEDFSLPADEDVELTLENAGVVEHDIVVEELDDRELVYANAGETVTETVNLSAGTYTFYCSIPGHRSAGMEGTLTVE
jgi:uncharacterized cupredoxin-like copper-binding protein